MKNIIKSAVILILVAVFSILLVFHVRKFTYKYIMEQETVRQNRAVESVLAGYNISGQITVSLDNGEKYSYWTGIKTVDDTGQKAFAFTSVTRGYNADIKAIVGVDDQNRILGVNFFQQTGAPGADERLAEAVMKESYRGTLPGENFSVESVKNSWFQEQFRGINPLKTVLIINRGSHIPNQDQGAPGGNSITAITGATNTTKIILDGIKDNLIKLEKARLIYQQELQTKETRINEQNEEDNK